MKVYEYKFTAKGSNGLKARGVCVAESLNDLFWHLDNVADPYSALFRVRDGLNVCFWEGSIENYSDDIGKVAKWTTFEKEGFYL